MKYLAYPFALALAVLSIHAGVPVGAGWTNVSNGLTGFVPGVKALVIDGAGSTLYALSSGNSIFKSTDGGANWQALGKITGVNALALDPTSASTIYAGTSRGVFASTDGGANWASAGLAGISVTILAVDPITPSTLYAAAGDANIYKSTDGSQSWTAYAVGFPSGPAGPAQSPAVSAFLLDPANPSTAYVTSAGFSSPLYRSTDGAETWNVINPGPVIGLLAIDPATTPSTLYGIVPGLTREFSYGFSKSTDGGATWAALALNQPVIALAIAPNNSNVLYAATYPPVGSPPVIYKSIDGGQNWNAVNSSMPFATALVFSPVDSSTVYAATNHFYLPNPGGIFRTTDAGMTWNQSNTGLNALGAQLLIGDPLDSATIYEAGIEGLFKSVDQGGSWSQVAAFQVTCCTFPPGFPPPPAPEIPPPFPAVEAASIQSLLIDFTNTSILYAGTARIGGCFFNDVLLFKSMDDGATWSNSINPDYSGCSDDTLMGMDPSDPKILYLRSGDDYDSFGLRKSTDGGATWNFTSLAVNALNALVIDPNSPATLYAETDDGVVGTTDGGATWNQLGLVNTNVSLLAIDRLQPNVLYACTTSVYPDTPGFTGVMQSTDRGVTWSPVNAGLEDLLKSHAQINALIVNPGNSDSLYLATTGFGVFKSSDGSATWAPFNDGLAFLDVRSLAIARGASPAVYAGTPGGVFKIADPGSRNTDSQSTR